MAFATEDGHPWHAVLEEKAFEAHDMPSVHARQGPGTYPGPFSVVNATTAAFAGQDPAQLTVPLELAQDGGATVSAPGVCGQDRDGLGTGLRERYRRVGRGRGQRSQPLALFHRVHGQRGKDMGRPVRASVQVVRTTYGPVRVTVRARDIERFGGNSIGESNGSDVALEGLEPETDPALADRRAGPGRQQGGNSSGAERAFGDAPLTRLKAHGGTVETWLVVGSA